MNGVKTDEFISVNDDNIEIYFSVGDKDYNKNIEDGRKNIEVIKSKFDLEDIKYISQIHSDIIINLIDVNKDTKNIEGDGIVTNLSNIGIGVFYADCVPIIIYDKVNGSIAAVHSGWRGTYKEIVKNALSLMKEKYNSKEENIKVVIGPHIGQCCYEVSEELKEMFNKNQSFYGIDLFKGRNLSLEKAILKTLKNNRIKEENIRTIKLCTYCDKENKLHSYRRDGENSGRCYSFIVKR